MTVLEKLTAWLESFPLWGEQGLCLDYLDAVPGSTGLYPEGAEQVARHVDILGTVTAVNRLRFVLYRLTDGQQDKGEHSLWLLELQKWIQGQSAAGLAPVFGDEPGREQILAQKGRLKSADQTGTGKYTVNLTVEFVTKYHK